MRFKRIIGLLLIVISPMLQAEPKVISVGVVPQFEARVLYSTWEPILRQLEQRTNLKFNLVTPASIPEFESLLLQGKLDLAYMNPYHLVLANKYSGYQPLLKDSSKQLTGILVVLADSPITSPSDLQGASVAFPSPNALGASLQMRQELFDDFQVEVESNYVKTHDSVYLNVLLGEVAAGGGVDRTLKAQKPEYQAMLKVIHRTQAVAPHPIAVHPRLSQASVNQIMSAFLAMGQDIEGQKILAKIPIKSISEAKLEDYKPLESMGLERFSSDRDNL